MQLTPEHEALRATVKRFIAEKVNPFVDQWEADEIFPAHQVFKQMGDLGLLGLNKPEENGGAGLDYSYAAVLAEALGDMNCGGIPMAIGVQTDMATPALAKRGSAELRAEFLTPAIAGDMVACLGVSEVGSGSDVASIKTRARKVIDDGRVQGYFLSTYSARKLGMPTTGNAGGSHNLSLTSSLTRASDDLPAMLKKLGTGLFVIELMGQGVNGVTGDYSRGASGFWVEKGEIAFPVQEITIAGNLKDMFLGMEAVGADTYNMGAKTVGSVLINRMMVAGS